MKKVLLYAFTEGFGGVERYMLNLLLYTENAKDKFAVIVKGKNTIYAKEFERLGIAVYYTENKVSKLFSIMRSVRNQYNTLYVNTSALIDPRPFIIFKLFRYGIYLHSHSSNMLGIKKYFHFINRKWVNLIIDKRFSCSEKAAKWMFNKGDYTFIPNAVNTDKYLFKEEWRRDIRNKYGIDDTTILLGCIGRLCAVKNQKFLLDVLYRLDNAGKSYKLMLIGSGEDGPALKKLTSKLGLDSTVIFTGAVNSTEKYLAALDCLLMPSLIEGFPYTLVEAQCSGLKCVASEMVTKEADLIGNVKCLPLSAGAALWAEFIAKMDFARHFDLEAIISKGFDIKDTETTVLSALLK